MKKTLLYLAVFLVFVVIVNTNAQNQINHYNDQGLSSESLLEEDVKIYSNMRDREFIRLGVDGRDKFRYVYKFFETRIYLLAINHLAKPAHTYVFVLYHSLVLFFIYIVSLGLFNFSKKKLLVNDIAASLLLLLLVSYLFATTNILSDERFTLVETLAVSIALYASINQKILMFIGAVLLGVSNRESAVMLSIFYPLINYRLISKWKKLVLSLSGFILLILLNFDIFQQINLEMIVYGMERNNRISVIKLISYIIKYGLFLLPLFFMLWSLTRDDIIYGKVLILVVLYLIMIFFGSFLGNTLLLFIFIPFYLFALGQYLQSFSCCGPESLRHGG